MNRTLKIIIVLLCFTCFSSYGDNNPLNVNNSRILTLRDAIYLALRYNPSVRNAEIQRVIDKFNLRLAENSFEVQYALTGNVNYSNENYAGIHSTQTNYGAGPSVSYLSPIGTQISAGIPSEFVHTNGSGSSFSPQVTFNITQPLLQGFGPAVTLAPLYNAYDQEQINQLALKNTIIQTITQVINQYSLLVQAENSLAAQQLALQTSVATVTQYQAQIKSGESAPADIIQFQNNEANTRLMVENQQLGVTQAKLNLLNILGLDPATQFSVPADIQLDTTQLPNLAQSITLALQNDIPYRTLLYQMQITQRQLLVAKDQQRWQLNAVASQAYGNGFNTANQPIMNNLGQNRETNVGLQLNIPINNLTVKSALVQAQVAVQQAEINLQATKHVVITNTTNAYYNLLSQQQQIQQAKTALQLAQINLNDATIRLKYGRSTPFEVSSLQTALTNANLALINTQINYVNAVAAFEQVLGVTLERWKIQIRY